MEFDPGVSFPTNASRPQREMHLALSEKKACSICIREPSRMKPHIERAHARTLGMAGSPFLLKAFITFCTGL